jgi:hypothetical protein
MAATKEYAGKLLISLGNDGSPMIVVLEQAEKLTVPGI